MSQAIRPKTVAAAETVEMPLNKIFIAAGSLRKLLLAAQATSAPVCMKKPNWMDDAPHTIRLDLNSFGQSQGFSCPPIVLIPII
jgi:hypothetical protein